MRYSLLISQMMASWCNKSWRLRLIFLLMIICFIIAYYLTYIISIEEYFMPNAVRSKFSKSIDRFAINTKGCQIPYLDPFDKKITRYINEPEQFNCSERPPLVNSDSTTLYINTAALEHYNTDIDTVECCYQPFWRRDPDEGNTDHDVTLGECIKFISSEITDEFVKVVCNLGGNRTYTDFHAFVPMKMNSNRRVQQQPGEYLNIIVIGNDAVSRTNLQRQMPKTVTVLIDELKAIEFAGYNKVADNTYPNLIPVLTGLSDDELKSLCWQNTRKHFDDCPFIWNEFNKSGYLTSYAEDASWMGLFNYNKAGFKHQPTDYYWKTFNYIAEYQIGHNKRSNAVLCLGPRHTYKVLIDYINKFTQTLKNTPHFGFFWATSLTHDFLNYPALSDDDYVEFFRRLNEMGILKNTLLIYMSDHGIRWGGIRLTHQGHLEERLPFLYFILPLWFKQKYPEAVLNLKRNRAKLTSPFDLHETLKDLLNLSTLGQYNETTLTNRGISLFLPIPETRTCEDAHISSHWCTCQRRVSVSKNDTIVFRAANYIVKHINSLLVRYRDCAKLKLDEIIDVSLAKSEDYLKKNTTMNDYTVTLKTKPGAAIFESTVRCEVCDASDPFHVTGTVSRVNLYGNTSDCMSDFHLKLYCYCGK